MKYTFLFAGLFILSFASCNLFDKKNPPATDTLTIKSTDTVRLTRDSIINQPVSYAIPAGFYQGMLPCKSCEGIQQTILFESDNSFKTEEVNWGTKTPPKKQEGKWEKKSDTILLYVNNKLASKFRFHLDSLVTLFRDGKAIDAGDMQNYLLLRKTSAGANTAWREKGEQGIDFYGVGNEPFWNIEIDNEKMILFKLADWQKPVIVPIEKPKIYNDSTVYIIPDSTRLHITIINEFCSDGMSDFLYEQKIQVRYKGQLYKGCGMWLGSSKVGN
jgi:uncharacterized membrane protein